MNPSFGGRDLDTTRGRVVALLRRGVRTVEELAQSLGLTDNAVRSHLTRLERDGIVRIEGSRRGPGAGKPATTYELHPDAETAFSRAYAPVLQSLISILEDELPQAQLEAILRRLGRSLAAGVSDTSAEDLGARVEAAAAVLAELGGEIEVDLVDGRYTIRGCSCPLAAAVAQHPHVCLAVESLVGDVARAEARSCCEHGARPRCRFSIDAA